MKKVKEILFPQYEDSRGKLVSSYEETIPFPIRTFFFIYDVDKEIVRGKHANKISEQVLVCICGSCKVKVIETDERNGLVEREFTLNKPNVALYIPNMVWKEMSDFCDGTILLCLSSYYYDEKEYIRDYNIYCEEVT